MKKTKVPPPSPLSTPPRPFCVIAKSDWPLEISQVYRVEAGNNPAFPIHLTLMGDQDLALLNNDPNWTEIAETQNSGEETNITLAQYERCCQPFRSYAGWRELVAMSPDLIRGEMERFLSNYKIESTVKRIANGTFHLADDRYPPRLQAEDGLALFWYPHKMAIGGTARYFGT